MRNGTLVSSRSFIVCDDALREADAGLAWMVGCRKNVL